MVTEPREQKAGEKLLDGGVGGGLNRPLPVSTQNPGVGPSLEIGCLEMSPGKGEVTHRGGPSSSDRLCKRKERGVWIETTHPLKLGEEATCGWKQRSEQCDHEPRSAQEPGEAGKSLPWSLRRVCGPVHTSAEDFQPPGLERMGCCCFKPPVYGPLLPRDLWPHRVRSGACRGSQMHLPVSLHTAQ